MRRLAIYAYHNPKGEVKNDVIKSLEDLQEIFDVILIVVNGQLTTEGRKSFNTIKDTIILFHEGKDSILAAYKAGIDYFGYGVITGLDELLLTDNPCLGPTSPCSSAWAIMEGIDCHFWCNAKQIPTPKYRSESIQEMQEQDFGFWLVFRKSLLCTKDFRKYWNDPVFFRDNNETPEEYEKKVVAFFLGLDYSAWEYNPAKNSEQYSPLDFNKMHQDLRKLRRQYLRYKFLSKITFGWRRKHYTQKKKRIKSQIAYCKARINRKGQALIRQPQTIDFQPIGYEEPRPVIFERPTVKAIAFYLPQFHAFPENDAWWGKGFTEWTNVKKAEPLFPGHYHPKEPSSLGYYDLTDSGVMKKQAEMAKEFGLYGFCFHYYWFAGKRLMELPLDSYLADKSIDFPFCLNWANENWTRRWDGRENQILIEQNHSDADDRAVMRDVIRYFRDPRYIRINEQPVFLVYRPILFPDMQETLQRWREECEKAGICAPYFVMCQSFRDIDPATYGFDAAVQFPPHPSSFDHYYPDAACLKGMTPEFQGRIFDYTETIEYNSHYYDPELPSYPCVFPEWDNTARRSVHANMFLGGSPASYGKWLRKVGMDVIQHFPKEKRFLFINAWNEWAEGAYLEPDAKHGYAYLNATSKVLAELNNKEESFVDNEASRLRVLFIGHDASLAGAQIVLLHTLRWLKRHTGIDVRLLLLGDGALLPKFKEECDTIVIDNQDFDFEEIRRFCPDPDVICGNTTVSPKCYDTIAEYKVPIVTWVHEMGKSIMKFSTPKIIKKMLKYTTHYIAVSQPVLSNLVDNYSIESDAATIINAFIEAGMDPVAVDKAAIRSELGLPSTGMLVAGMGTLDWRKGADLFVEAAKRICEAIPDKEVSFCWVGGGLTPEIPDPRELAERYGLSERIFFVGSQTETIRFLQAADLFLLTSREDPFPLVALEACSCRLPVVCFADSGGMPAFIATGPGKVVPFEDVSAMAQAAVELLQNGEERKRLGGIARTLLVESYTSDNVVPHILGLLRRVAGKPYPVSVIVPNYNYANYLPQRMNSIFRQTYQDMEVIILDDASTDNSFEVINQWRNKAGVRIIRNENNSGSVCLQWKKGMQEAKGEFIWIAEADDDCDSVFLEKMLSPFQDPDVILAYSIPCVIDAEGRKAKEFDYRENYLTFAGKGLWYKDYVIDGREEICGKLGIVNCIPNASAVVFRNIHDESVINTAVGFKCSGDWVFYLNMATKGKLAYVHGSFAQHRRHDKSVIASDAQKNHTVIRSEIQKIHSWVLETCGASDQIKRKMDLFLEAIT